MDGWMDMLVHGDQNVGKKCFRVLFASIGNIIQFHDESRSK